MRIRLLSDLHNEFSTFIPEELDADIVVLAGDIDTKTRGISWALEHFSCPVLYVLGNHEFYGGHLAATLEKMRELGGDRVRILERDAVELEGVRFLGTTCWTDFASTGNAVNAARAAQEAMWDFRAIRTDSYRPISTADLVREASKSKRWLQETLRIPFPGKTVVITHHAPTLKSIQGSPHAGGLLDAAFANDWEDMLGPAVDLWLHGHSHHSIDFVLNGTRVISNARGYPNEQTGFRPNLILEV